MVLAQCDTPGMSVAPVAMSHGTEEAPKPSEAKHTSPPPPADPAAEMIKRLAPLDPRPLSTKSDQALTTIDSQRNHSTMSTNTMSFALPEAMRSYVDQRVRSGQYGNTSEYLRELIRRDQEEQAKKRLRELIEEGLNSGPGQPFTPQRAAALKKQALGKPR